MERPLNLAPTSLLAWAAIMMTWSATFSHADDAAHVQQAQENLPAFTKAREAAAMVFVKEHQPELLELLKLVHEKNAGEYQKAIRQFFVWSEKVADTKSEDKGAVAAALQGWAFQIQSQILSAQMLRHPDKADELKQQLRQVFEHAVDLQAAHLSQQIVQAEQHLEALRKQHESLASKRDEIVQERLTAVDQLIAKHREQGD